VHSALRAASISSSVVRRDIEKRIAAGFPIAFIVGDGSVVPEKQAPPLETQISAASSAWMTRLASMP
jgi:hypothetical protein